MPSLRRFTAGIGLSMLAAVSVGAHGAVGKTAAAPAAVAPAAEVAKPAVPRVPAAAVGMFSPDAWAAVSTTGVDAKVFDLALSAASCAVRSGDVPVPTTLTVIDYSKPSTEKRLWVFDVADRQLLYKELVAHGKGSGDNVPTTFSNTDETHASSLGLFVTRDTYTGKNGYSLRLDGLDAGFNDHALQRAIVMHGAPYVNDATAKSLGRLGRSWGCPALNAGIAREVIDRVKGGNLIFAYYPDAQWLAKSKYLGECASTSSPNEKLVKSSAPASIVSKP
jgi:hypothetical protein